MLGAFLNRSGNKKPTRPTQFAVERLEDRAVPAVTATLNAGVLNIVGDSANDFVRVSLDTATNQLVVRSALLEVGRFDSAAVASINLDGDGGQKNVLTIDPNVTQPAVIQSGSGNDIVRSGGGPTTALTGAGRDKIVSDGGNLVADGGADADRLFRIKATDTILPDAADTLSFAIPRPAAVAVQPAVLTEADVQTLLRRAAGASASNDGIFAILDRGGRLLGVYVENGVAPEILNNPQLLGFAIDGAIAKARTGAFFGNNEAPLTSRTIQNLSQTTMTEREIHSNPFDTNPNSTTRGPGFVAPVGLKNHFPPGVPYTPQVDLFAIEHTNRDSIISPGANRIREGGGGDDITLPGRFNIAPQDYRPDIVAEGLTLQPPEAYGFLTGIDRTAQARGIATLPGGIPIYKTNSAGDREVVGGIGAFFPGKTGYASEENSQLSDEFDPTKPDRSMEAEFIAFAAVGGVFDSPTLRIGDIAGIPNIPTIGINLLGTGRIDLIGITLDVFGPRGNQGPEILADFGSRLGVGNPFAGTFQNIDTMGNQFIGGKPVPDGFIVPPRDGNGITAAEVNKIIQDGIAQADTTRAAIRLPFNRTARMVFAVSDLDGNIVGLYRQSDATIFSIDVAVAKARNVAYYANPAQLQAIDRVDATTPGTAFTNRSFRYLSLPRYPEGIDGSPAGPFSIINDGNVNPLTGGQQGPQLPASAFQSVQGFDAFNPQSNFHSPFRPENQNGIVFFPGSAPLYRRGGLIGGFGVSGDGVDQDDVVTTLGATGFEPPAGLRVDEVFIRGVRVPYNKFNRNPEGGIVS